MQISLQLILILHNQSIFIACSEYIMRYIFDCSYSTILLLRIAARYYIDNATEHPTLLFSKILQITEHGPPMTEDRNNSHMNIN